MTARLGAAEAPPGPPAPLTRSAGLRRWLGAALETARPRQWPKNLLVFAAPLAGDTLGRHDGLGYALVAVAAFTAASAAVYYANDVVNADRDRRHPVKRRRAVASGRLPAAHALALAGLAVAGAVGASLAIDSSALAGLIGAYLISSFLYSLVLKHVPVVELLFVASGFVLRALGGAAATRVPPSTWFLVVCSLGALMVATAKRFTELEVLGPDAARHRPVMRWYTPVLLRLGQRAITVAMISAYLLWAWGEHGTWLRAMHLASAVPLTAALIRFDWLTTRQPGKPVEDLISRDGLMVCCELAWLTLFVVGL